jgi:murein DD-endopeptidase MepM/ murein hydrolase activator NlpD
MRNRDASRALPAFDPARRCGRRSGGVLAVATLLLIVACSDRPEPLEPTGPVDAAATAPETDARPGGRALPVPRPPLPTAMPRHYAVRPPAGKLPWPQHDPTWTRARYEAMLDSIWVINNYGLYQGGGDRTTLYLHDALDLVLPNGTPIRSVATGTVRANIGGNEFYRSLVVEDEDEPGFGWAYTHIYGFQVEPGERVGQGVVLGHVNFQGLPHVHLSRVQLRPGGWWQNYNDLIKIQPDAFFVYTDTEPPVFEGPFRYVRNESDEAFLPTAADPVVTVSGDVDIAVGLRDPGEWSGSKTPVAGITGYGARNSPNRVEYDIRGPDGTVHSYFGFDLSKTLIPRVPGEARAAQVLTLYQYYEAVAPPPPPVGNWHAKFNFYVITNSDGQEPASPRPIDPADAAHAWRTAALDEAGRRVFPDGDYAITVRAYDFAGNMATRTETVRVRN